MKIIDPQTDIGEGYYISFKEELIDNQIIYKGNRYRIVSKETEQADKILIQPIDCNSSKQIIVDVRETLSVFNTIE